MRLRGECEHGSLADHWKTWKESGPGSIETCHPPALNGEWVDWCETHSSPMGNESCHAATSQNLSAIFAGGGGVWVAIQPCVKGRRIIAKGDDET